MAKITSIYSRGIRHKLAIAICLMSVIPLLICLNYIFPSFFTSFISKANLACVILITFFIIALGILVIKQIVDPVVELSRDAQLIASGDLKRRIEIKSDDEIGQLASSLNQLTAKIKESMDELKGYGSKTAEINFEIQKRIVVMSGLLQISGLISQAAPLEEILHLCVEKLKGFADSSLGFFLSPSEDGQWALKAQNGLEPEAACGISLSGHNECIEHIFKKHTASILDARNPQGPCQKFASSLRIKNFLCLPVFAHQKPVGILGVGNNIEDFAYARDDCELLDIFAKQAAIAIENDLLLRAVERLEIRDALTGLYNEQYIINRLDEEIKRAIIYQRPCSFILASLRNFAAYQKAYGQIASEGLLKKVASCLGGAFQGVERVGRFSDYEFAVIVPEKNKRQAEKIAEDLKLKVEGLFEDEPQIDKKIILFTAVAENPLDGVSPQELISCARVRLVL